jgi:AAA domain
MALHIGALTALTPYCWVMVMDLLHWVAQRIDEDENLSEEAGLLVLAALDSDAALDTYLDGGGSPTLPRPDTIPESEPEPAGAYLVSVQVQGFRGIGERVTLALTPQPGFTIISGRNGSGKSSLAEALEVALTGSTYRWKNKAAQWKEH